MAGAVCGDVFPLVSGSLHTFLQPTVGLHGTFLQLAKTYLDPLANDVTNSQELRQKDNRGKKRRLRDQNADGAPMLKMRRVHVEGFDVAQVWQQAKRILDAAEHEVERMFPEEDEESAEDVVDSAIPDSRQNFVRFEDEVSQGEHAEEDNDQASNDDEDIGKEDVDWQYDAGGVNGDRGIKDRHYSLDGSDYDDENESREEFDESGANHHRTLVKDKFGLNDGFFSIDDFNKQSQFFEQADTRGEDDGAASDEEEIDWTVDPMRSTTQKPQPGRQTKTAGKHALSINDSKLVDDSSDGEYEHGPTFGNMDLDAPEGESDAEGISDDDDGGESMGGLANTNDILYADFFAPPAQMPSKRVKSRPKGQTSTELGLLVGSQTQDDEMARTISAVHRDLFDDESSADEDSFNHGDAAQTNLSTHERRQLALRAEIRTLEAANVSSKPWTLTGEALAPARPLNSLLEEDLDFERAGKPVPVVTDAVHEDMEALIKRRILARDFDEVVRRRPTDLVTGPSQKRGRVSDFELSDARPAKSLAEEYAEDHLKQTDPSFIDSRSQALQAKHVDIEKHWSAISSQLDVLCNWHYKPRPPQIGIEVRVDLPRIAMEEARPNAAGDGIGESILAPQEVYKAGDEQSRTGEVVTRGGLPIAREEESREQRKRRRQRAKERIRKASGNNTQGAANAVSKAGRKQEKPSQKDVLGQLKKGGVKVIGRDGEIRAVDGTKMNSSHPARPPACLKL